MEEFVGKIWHNWVTGAASKAHLEAQVELDDVRKTAGILFRAMGGEGGLRIETASAIEHGARRGILQRIAGTGDKSELAWRDAETLRLPARIAVFSSKTLNRNLYLWLAALAASDTEKFPDWFPHNRRLSAATLKRFPGLRKRYFELVEAHIADRPTIEKLTSDEAAQEKAIRAALRDPDTDIEFPVARKRPFSVPLWLHPAPPIAVAEQAVSEEDDDDPEDPEDPSAKNIQEDRERRKAERADMPDGRDGLLGFRLESLFTWAEFVKVDRTTEDDEDEDSMSTLEDMEVVSVARDTKTTASRIRLDLDLPSQAYDDIYLGEGIPLPEWDYKSQTLIKDHCRLQLMEARDAVSGQLPDHLRRTARRIRNQFEALRPTRVWHGGLSDGSELDLDAYIAHTTDQKLGVRSAEGAVYRDCRHSLRDLSCLLLADLSLSTDAWVSNDARVIDIIQDSVFLFSEALNATSDRFSLCGFSSKNRGHVRFHQIKSFSDSYNEVVKARIAAMKPGYYTRMGAAIRHATSLLEKESSEQRILLLLTDGKPNDLDKYEGRYGIEDTRMALMEAEKKGLRPFCVTIDERAEDYLPYLFGSRSYILIKKAEELPKKLPLLYARLTGSA